MSQNGGANRYYPTAYPTFQGYMVGTSPLLLLHQSICLTNKPQICQIRLRDKIAEVPRGSNEGIQSATLFLMHGHNTIKVS